MVVCFMPKLMLILKSGADLHNLVREQHYITLSPCKDCSKLIHQSGIKRVVHLEEYKDCSGVDFQRKQALRLSYIPKLR